MYRTKQVPAVFAMVRFHGRWSVGKGCRLPAQCSTVFTACEAGHSPPVRRCEAIQRDEESLESRWARMRLQESSFRPSKDFSFAWDV